MFHQRRRIARTFGGGLVVLLLAAGIGEAKEGFGRMNRQVAQLVRVRPPAVFLMQTRIDVRAGGATHDLAALARRLESQLEAELIERDSRLMVDSQSPAITVDVELLQNAGEERWESRRVQVQRKVGTDRDGKPRYDWVETTVRYKVVIHDFEVSYTVVDRVDGRSLDADTIRLPYRKEFQEGQGAPEMFNLESNALAATAERIALRITPSREVIGVLLPKGSLEDLSKLAQAGLWTRFLEGLERSPSRPDALDESYRQYALGTAYEALGYGADDPETTLRYLQQADVHYGQAIDANPGEKFFIRPYDAFLTSKTAEAPLDRVREAIASYRRLEDFQNAENTLEPVAEAGGKALFPQTTAERKPPSAKEMFYDRVSRFTGRASPVEPDHRPVPPTADGFAGPVRVRPERRRLLDSAPVETAREDDPGPIGLSVWIELAGFAGGSGHQVTDRRVFRSGELIRLHFRGNADGYLILVLLGSSGTSSVLFPDPARGLVDNDLVAGRELVVPGEDAWLRFDQNPGEERLIALFARSIEEIGRFPVQPVMDRVQTAAFLASAAEAAAGQDLLVETEVHRPAEVGTYGVHLGGKPVVLELVFQHR